MSREGLAQLLPVSNMRSNVSGPREIVARMLWTDVGRSCSRGKNFLCSGKSSDSRCPASATSSARYLAIWTGAVAT